MRRVLMPKWWLLHVGLVVAVLVMLRLGLWQWHRATSPSGGIQNYAYAFQWPLFAVFAIVLWARTLVEEARRDPNAPRHGDIDAARASQDVVRRPGLVIGVTTPEQPPGAAVDDDPELAAWNARLAALAAATTAVETRRR